MKNNEISKIQSLTNSAGTGAWQVFLVVYGFLLKAQLPPVSSGLL